MNFTRVIDASPLIVFQRIGQPGLLQDVLGHVYAPPAVCREVYGDQPTPDWITERPPVQPLATRVIAARLGFGESAAIALALEMNADELVLDDLAARRLAVSLRLRIIGSVGLVLRAKDRKLIEAVRPILDAMKDQQFHISEHVFLKILAAAGES